MLTATIYVSIALATVCYLSDYLFSLWDPPNSPPRVRSRIPLIGHFLGLIQYGTGYYTRLSGHQHSDVYTIGIFNLKIYVVNSRRLIPLIQRQSKTLSFTPFQQFAAKVYVNCSAHTVDLHANADFMREFDRSGRVALAPGPDLDYQNLRAAESLKKAVEEVARGSSSGKPVKVGLYDWSKHTISLAATNGVFGNSSPFSDRAIEEAFWTWNEDMPTIIAGLGILVPQALRARDLLIASFNKYVTGDYSDAAEVIKSRIRVLLSYKAPTDDIARMILSFNMALLPNTAPTAFWTLYNIFSRPALLQELRDELECAISRYRSNEYKNDNAVNGIDIVALKTKCPLLLSVFEETQRTSTAAANIRKVMENTMLDNFMLQKGNYVQIPNGPIHHSAELWGSDSAVFNPNRFVKEDGTTLSSSLPSNSFLAWGAAPHLCPARQFASTEILTMAALMILRVEMEPVGGIWKTPEPKVGDLATVLPPKRDVEVEIRPRDGWAGEWVLKMGESTSKVPLASG